MAEKILLEPIYIELSKQHIIKIRRDKYRCSREINIYGKIFCNNIPVKGAIVVLFRIVENKKIPLKRCITDQKGNYSFRFNNYSYRDEVIGITSFNGWRKITNKRNVRTKKCNIEVNPVKDVILYGKIIDSYGYPIEGAIVVAFYEDENEMQAICHTFSDIDGIYVLNIKYDLYKDKKIIVKSVNASYSTIVDYKSEVHKGREYED